jgi:hypothetical protein
MQTNKRTLGLGAAAVIAVALVGSALAAFPDDNVTTYTGCVHAQSGAVSGIAEGATPVGGSCGPNSSLIHLSGGDITSIVVGQGLTGGGVNGAVSIGLDATHSLPQNCLNGQVPKANTTGWACGNDNDTTSSAGTGLDLAGTTFSVEPDAFVKKSQACTAGQFATGADGSGNLTCAAPPPPPAPTLQSFVSAETGLDLPTNSSFVTAASVNVPVGTYMLTAKGSLNSADETDSDFTPAAQCRLSGGDTVFFLEDSLEDLVDVPFALTSVVNTAAATLKLECRAEVGADGLHVSFPKLVALKIG